MVGLKSLIPSPLKPPARRVRRAVQALWPPAHREPLPAGAGGVAVRAVRWAGVADCGAEYAPTLAVTNHGPFPIGPAGRYPVGVAADWRAWTGEPAHTPTPFAPLPVTLQPGQEKTFAVPLAAPRPLGDYVLRLSVVQFGGPALPAVGPTPRLDVLVSNPASEDINYPETFATGDLNADFWTKVGPPSREEYESLKAVKLKLLVDQGLTPDSRLLDVGCGTGLLASAVEPFLSARGRYFGTDIGKEAVDFCRRIYTRPNFQFAVNGMTTLPVAGEVFDAIAYYSVFTHTYPDETALLLAESKRVLAPNGFILADCFTSPLVLRSAGNRYAVEVNPDHLVRLVEAVGLRAEFLFHYPWKERARRQFLRLTHR